MVPKAGIEDEVVATVRGSGAELLRRSRVEVIRKPPLSKRNGFAPENDADV